MIKIRIEGQEKEFTEEELIKQIKEGTILPSAQIQSDNIFGDPFWRELSKTAFYEKISGRRIFYTENINKEQKKKDNSWGKGCLGCLGVAVFLILIGIICSTLDKSSLDKTPSFVTKVEKRKVNWVSYVKEVRKIHQEINAADDLGAGYPIYADKDPIRIDLLEVVWEIDKGWYELSKKDKEFVLSGDYIGLLSYTTGSEGPPPKVVFVNRKGNIVGYVCGYDIVVY